MNGLQPYTISLPTELRYEIAKTAYHQHTEDVGKHIQNAPIQSFIAIRKERARAEFNFGLLGADRIFREATFEVIDPDACTHFVKNEVSKLAEETKGHDSPAQFKEGVRKLVSRYPGVDFDFNVLDSAQLKACLNVLQESRGGHLKKVNLNFAKKLVPGTPVTSLLSMEEAETLLLPAVKSLAEHHPRVKTALLLSRCDLRGTNCDFGALGAVAQLDLESSRLDKATFISIFRGMRNSSIEELDLSNAIEVGSLDVETVHELALSLPSARDLKTLDMTNSFDSDSSNACAHALASTLGNTGLEYLYLGENDISIGADETGGGASIVRNLPQSLACLDLSVSDFNENLHLLASKLDQASISNLVLDECGVTGSELEANMPGQQVTVARKLLNAPIYRISLNSNIDIGDSGATAIARALQGTGVRELILSGCGIHDDGFRALASAMPDCMVTKLDLSANPLGAVGAEALCAAIRNPMSSLSLIDLSQSSLDRPMCHYIAITAANMRRPMTLILADEHFSINDAQLYRQFFPLLDLVFVM